MSPIFKWNSNIRDKRRRISLKKRECERKNIYTQLRNVAFGIYWFSSSLWNFHFYGVDVPFALGTNFSRLLSAKIAKVHVCVCIRKSRRRKVGRTCKDNFHELGLTVSLRYNKFSRIIIIPRFRTASNFRQIFSREVGRVISGLSKLSTSLRLISTTFSLHSLCLRLPSFVKKFISPSLSLSPRSCRFYTRRG